MPSRLPSTQGFRSLTLCLRTSVPSFLPRFLPRVQIAQASRAKRLKPAKSKRLDPYSHAQLLQRKEANRERKREIQRRDEEAKGDPVSGIPTPFVESLYERISDQIPEEVEDDEIADIGADGPPRASKPSRQTDDSVADEPSDPKLYINPYNYFLTPEELDAHIDYARSLIIPQSEDLNTPEGLEVLRKQGGIHRRAAEAVRRIVSLSLAGGKMKQHNNITRCIDAFGRHNTDKAFGLEKPKLKPFAFGSKNAAAAVTADSETEVDTGAEANQTSDVPEVQEVAVTEPEWKKLSAEEYKKLRASLTPEEFLEWRITQRKQLREWKKRMRREAIAWERAQYTERDGAGNLVVGRVGPDTGSPEVQIAILTLKIKNVKLLLDQKRGWKNLHGKRDLRLLVHRRQKMLKYLMRKEPNSSRWHHLIETLGLTPGAWQREITLR